MIFIPGSIPSSKNSKIATAKGVFHSKTVAKWLREIGILHYSTGKKEVDFYKTKKCSFPFDDLKNMFKDVGYPCEIGLHFVRKTKTKFDFHNISQIIFDIMVAGDVIPDDNIDFVIPFVLKIDNKWYSIDKENPGVWIDIKK